MSTKIFDQVLKAVKTGSSEVLLFPNVDPEDFANYLKILLAHSNRLDKYSFRKNGQKVPLECLPIEIHFLTPRSTCMLRKNNNLRMRSGERCGRVFRRKLIFADTDGFEAGLNGLDGGYSDDGDGGGGAGGAGGGGITLGGDGDADAGVDLQPLKDDELFFVGKGLSSTDVIPTRDIPRAGCDSWEEEEDGEEECLPA
ncbi:hypothetical protein HOY82DRAFT_595310 [Tuber indicum]|nr:hypothetical protein HOY82DRAFT_595310 [Tuber indicum]